MPSGHCKYETAGSGSGLAALARWLWLGGSGSGCNPDRVTPDFFGCNPDRVTPGIVGATRTGLHQITWVQPGQGYTRFLGRNLDRVTPDFKILE